jgi:hypothetical protein
MPLTGPKLEALVNGLTIGLREKFDADLAPLMDRLARLEARPTVGVEYAGVHELEKSYPAGVLVTKRGGLWLSLRETTQTPGMDPRSWKLVVKSGEADR